MTADTSVVDGADTAATAAVDDVSAPTGPTPTVTRDPSRPVRWALRLVAVVPFLTAAIRALATDWFPIGDSAQLYIRATDVGTRHHPWLGAWSSLSTSLDVHLNNPGPLYADLIAPFAHLFGPGPGNVLGVTTINVACLLGAAAAARRIGQWRFERWVLVAGAGLAWTLGSELLFDIFQAHALLFPFFLLFVLVIGVLHRLSWPWPWLAATASLILQTHVSYAYIVTIIGITMLTLVVAGTEAPRRPALEAALRTRTALFTAVVVVVLWSQTFLEQIFGEGRGNLSRLVTNASGSEVTVGFGNAVKLVAAIVSLPPWWSRDGFADTIEPAGAVATGDGVTVVIPGLPDGGLAVAALFVTVALVVACLRRAHRQGDRTLRTMAIMSLTGIGGAVLSLSRLSVGDVGLAPHHTRWVFVIGLMTHVTLVWTAAEWLIPRVTPGREHGRRRDDATVLTAAIIVTLSLSNIPAYAQQHGPTDDAHTMPALRTLFDSLDVLDGRGPVLYRTANLRLYEPYSSAIQLELRQRGIEFRVDGDIVVRHLGNSRRSDGTEAVSLTQYEAWQALSAEGCVIGRASRFDAEVDTETRRIADDLTRRIGVAPTDVNGVLAAAGARDIDVAMAERIRDGDDEALREIVYDGRLRSWLDQGWATTTTELAVELQREGPAVTEWLNSWVALVVSPATVCDG